MGLGKGDKDLIHFVHITGQNKIAEQRSQGFVNITTFKIKICNEKLENFKILSLTQKLAQFVTIYSIILKKNMNILW
jgi:hypothetical protein